MSEVLVNRVAQSGLITINPESFMPQADGYAVFDVKDFLYKELILKEKAYREALKEHNWQQYENKAVGITCSNEALVPQWAYMLAATYLTNIALKVVYATKTELIELLAVQKVEQLLEKEYKDARLVIKGCGDKVPQQLYISLVTKLQKVAKSIMYGEPCSTVPLFKRKIVNK